MRTLITVLLACLGGCASSGTISVVVEGVTGAEGLLLVTEARDEAGNQAAIACTSIDADPFDVTQVLEEIVGPTPCEESAVLTLAPGTYDLTTGVIAGGETEPSQCAEARASVDGDVSVTMPALGACG